jgi:hypothetical protein
MITAEQVRQLYIALNGAESITGNDLLAFEAVVHYFEVNDSDIEVDHTGTNSDEIGALNVDILVPLDVLRLAYSGEFGLLHKDGNYKYTSCGPERQRRPKV